MCAGTVVEPPVPVSAASVSVTSRSRSVAFSDSLEFSARISTLPRIGMVLRRSTTRCTWPSDFSSCARSTVTFIAIPAWYLRWKSRAARKGSAAALETRKARSGSDLSKPPGGPQGGADGPPVQGRGSPVPPLLGQKMVTEKHSPCPLRKGRETGRREPLFLQLALQRFDL